VNDKPLALVKRNFRRGDFKMVHERDDEYEGQEDGEYHFSDDQANYEIEPEATDNKPPSASVATAAPKTTAASGGPNKMRRPMIGAAVFAVVIFLVYKILSPSASLPASDFNQTTVATSKTVTKTKTVPAKKVIVKTTPMTPPVQAPVVAPVVTTMQPTPAYPAAQPAAPVVVQINPGAAPSMTGMPAAPEANSAQVSAEIDKLISLQDQNTKLINQFQAESAQKINEYQTQNSELQNKLQDMNSRINNLEATLTHLTQVLQNNSGGSNNSMMRNNNNMAAREGQNNEAAPQMMARPTASMPKSIYTVQAIIPGRAWLKNDNGETVTVAEGDILRNYGKIMKIDPYDGVVQIDVGGRIVSLSYGAAAE
jgi:hypothetical protein